MLLVEKANETASRHVFVGRNPGRKRKVADWLLSRHYDGLMLGRQEAVAPVRLAIRRLAADIWDRDIRRQVFIFTSQGKTDPGAGAWKTFEDRPGVHEHATRAVRVCFRLHGMDERDVVDVPSHIGKKRADHFAALARGGERPGAFHHAA